MQALPPLSEIHAAVDELFADYGAELDRSLRQVSWVLVILGVAALGVLVVGLIGGCTLRLDSVQ